MGVTAEEVLGPGSPLARRMNGYEHREGQLAMTRAVTRALAQDRHLFVEAGTGTGKTLAYLVPALLSGRKVVVSTATHALQEQIFAKDLPLVRAILEEHGVVFRAALMKGLSNYLCKRRMEERLRSGEAVTAELARVERWALETETGDRGELATLEEGAPAWRDVQSGSDTRIGAQCKFYDECFVTRMRRAADEASLVVVNHHLFFADLALKAANEGYGGAIPPYDAVVFDEAHQIESVATDFFGVRVSSARLDALVRDARRATVAARVLDQAWLRAIDGVDIAGEAFFRVWLSASSGPSRLRDDAQRRVLAAADWTAPRRDALGRLDAALEALFRLADAQADEGSETLAIVARRASTLRADLARVAAGAEERERHWEADDEADQALRAATRGFTGAVTWLDVRERTVSLGASPVDLAPLLRERLFERVPTVICTSATLATAMTERREPGTTASTFAFAKSRLGARPEADELVVASPFDFASRAMFYVAEDLPEPASPGFDEACADRVAELVAITGGGAFVLCTSTRAMRTIHAALVGRVPGDLLVQGAAPKQALLDRFRASGEATLVATMSFWEGVDVPGHALRLVVLDKIPFAVPTDPVVAARCARIEAEGGNPFTQYSVPSAAITLKQGFGRLIRTRKDAGVVALLDRRAVRRGYGKLLLESLPPARRTTSLEAVREFWWDLDPTGA